MADPKFCSLVLLNYDNIQLLCNIDFYNAEYFFLKSFVIEPILANAYKVKLVCERGLKSYSIWDKVMLFVLIHREACGSKYETTCMFGCGQTIAAPLTSKAILLGCKLNVSTWFILGCQ